MNLEISLATILSLQKYCVDFDLQLSRMLGETRAMYDEKVRLGRTEATYNDWLNVKIIMMRADKEA